jgi:hypothetical protein
MQHLDAFYEVYAESVRSAGLPVFPRPLPRHRPGVQAGLRAADHLARGTASGWRAYPPL